MRPILINTDEWASTLPEIKSLKITENGKIVKDGLFSQQIFGPVKSYHCGCTKNSYKGASFTDFKVCPACGVEITTSEERRKRFAKIKLPFPVMNPLFYLIVTNGRSKIKKIVDGMLEYREKYYFDEQGTLHKLHPESNEPPPNGEKVLTGLDGVLVLIDNLIPKLKRKADIDFYNNNKHLFVVNNVIVIPPDQRPHSKNSSTNEIISDELNRMYIQILARCEYFKKMPLQIETGGDIFKSNFRYIQVAVLQIYKKILERLSKKKGLIRSNILGKRVDFSGRAVISPDPTLTLKQCKIPYYMILEMFKPQFTTYLVNRRMFKRYNAASKHIDECIKTKKEDLFEYVVDFCKDKLCILNRQPTLHRMSVLGFNIVPTLGQTIGIHPMICPPMNADFDGDCMAIFIPITEKSHNDIQTKIGMWNNLVSPTDLSVVPQPNQDIVLGIFNATKE